MGTIGPEADVISPPVGPETITGYPRFCDFVVFVDTRAYRTSVLLSIWRIMMYEVHEDSSVHSTQHCVCRSQCHPDETMAWWQSIF